MAKVLVTGATGLLGTCLVPALQAAGHTVLRHGHQAAADLRADLTSAAEVDAMLAAARPDVIVNLVALTNVDGCEADPDAAYRLNALAVENLARYRAAHLVQVSTDMVYDGSGAQTEEQLAIRNTYALSKRAGELAALAAGATVLRTNFFGRSQRAGRSSFTDWLYQAAQAKTPIKVFDDVWFSPLSMTTLAAMLAVAVDRKIAGVFNLGSRAGMSKADFAFAFAAALGVAPDHMQRAEAASAGVLKAVRPKDMRMDVSRFEQAFGVRLPTLMDEINLTRKDYP